MIILTLKIQTSRFLLDRSRASESDLHLVKPSVMEKPALGPLIKLGPTAAAHPVTDKESSTSDPSGRRPNQILRIQSVEESESGSRQQQRARGFNSEEEEEEEEELKISLRVEGFQPPASTGSSSISRRSESKENLNPRQEDHQQQQQQKQHQQHSDHNIQPTGKKAKKFRARNETNEKFLDMEPLPEPPPTPPSRSGDVSNGGGGGGGGSSTGSQTRSSSPIPIPRGKRSVRKRGKSFFKGLAATCRSFLVYFVQGFGSGSVFSLKCWVRIRIK